jgi:hypothetical protein
MTTTRERTGGTSTTVEGTVPPPRLVSTLVRYDRRPDRRTVHPPELSGVPRMSRWLTADDEAFVDLETVR